MVSWPRRLFRSSQPAAACRRGASPRAGARIFGPGGVLPVRQHVPHRVPRLGSYRSLEPYTKTPGRSSSGPSESRRYPTASGCAMESPVLTTRSGSRSSSDRIQDMSRLRPGVRCASEMCRMRSGAEPGGRTGTSYRRRANQFRSITVA